MQYNLLLILIAAMINISCEWKLCKRLRPLSKHRIGCEVLWERSSQSDINTSLTRVCTPDLCRVLKTGANTNKHSRKPHSHQMKFHCLPKPLKPTQIVSLRLCSLFVAPCYKMCNTILIHVLKVKWLQSRQSRFVQRAHCETELRNCIHPLTEMTQPLMIFISVTCHLLNYSQSICVFFSLLLFSNIPLPAWDHRSVHVGHIVAVCTIVITVIREVGGAVVDYGAVHRRPAGVHVLVVVVIWVVVFLLEAPVSIPSVSPVIPILAFRGVVRVNDVSPEFGFQILAAFARLVPVDLLQLVWLQHIQLRLLLHVGWSQVLFGVVVSSEGPALSHEAGTTKNQQENQK